MISRAFPEGRDSEANFFINLNFIDYDFIDNFNIEMIAGRKSFRKYSTDLKDAFIINEATVRKMGISRPDEV